MLRRMLALVALVSLMALAACNSDVAGVKDVAQEPDRARDRFQDEFAPAPDEIEDPGEGGGGGGGGSDQRRTAAENQRRRGGEEVAP